MLDQINELEERIKHNDHEAMQLLNSKEKN